MILIEEHVGLDSSVEWKRAVKIKKALSTQLKDEWFCMKDDQLIYI